MASYEQIIGATEPTLGRLVRELREQIGRKGEEQAVTNLAAALTACEPDRVAAVALAAVRRLALAPETRS